MTAIAYYLLKMLICSGILTGYYYACLQNKLFHQWNRFYLLLTVIFSITFPLLYIPVFDFSQTSNAAAQIVYKVSASELLLLKGQTQTFSFSELVIYGVYSLIALVFLLLFIVSLCKIFLLKKKSTFIQQSEISIYQTNAPQAPFSFFKNIFWRRTIDLQSTEGRQILKHELVHVHEKHSVDKVFMQLVLSVFWINPFFWLIKKELTMIHEFIADKKSVENNDASVLASLILTTAYSSGRFDITNQFFQSSIKRRITMITKNKDPRFSYLRRIAALFVLLATLGMLAFRAKNVNEVNPVKSGKDTSVRPQKILDLQGLEGSDTVKNIIYMLDNKQVSRADLKDLTTNKVEDIEFHLEQRNDKVFTVVNITSLDPKKKGSISLQEANPIFYVDGKQVTEKEWKSLNPNDIQSINVWKGEKAINKFGEKGKYGVVEVIMKKGNTVKPTVADTTPKRTLLRLSYPVSDKAADTIRLAPVANDDKLELRADKFIIEDNKEVHPFTQANQPLYMVDGKEITAADFKAINGKDVESITVWKNTTAIERFGDKGKNGVIDVKTRKTIKPISLTP